VASQREKVRRAGENRARIRGEGRGPAKVELHMTNQRGPTLDVSERASAGSCGRVRQTPLRYETGIHGTRS